MKFSQTNLIVYFQVKEDGVLQIESTRSVDAGEYSCVGENVVGFDTDYIGLFVGSPPSFLQKPKGEKILIYIFFPDVSNSNFCRKFQTKS